MLNRTKQNYWENLQVRGTPCKCCSRSQQRSTRIAAQVNSAVSLDRTGMVNITFSHHLFCCWYMTKNISHTCARRSCRPARYLSSSTDSHTSKRCLATALRVSSSITTGHYVLNKDVDPKRLGSENNAMKENATSSHLMTPLVLLQQHLQQPAVLLVLMNRIFCVCRRSVLFLGSWRKDD